MKTAFFTNLKHEMCILAQNGKAKIGKKYCIREIENREKEISKYVRLHNDTTYDDSYKQMVDARLGIANYAKANGVQVDIYDARKILPGKEDVSQNVKNNLSDKIKVVVSDLKNKARTRERFVSADTDTYTPRIKQERILIPSRTEECIESVRTVTSYIEDNFLRNLYRNIEEMTNQLHRVKNK